MTLPRWMIVGFTAAACAGCGGAQKGTAAEKAALMKDAKVEVTEAIKTATTKVPGRVVDTELRSKNGKPVWEVDVLGADGKTTEVDVDAVTGQITDME